MALTLVASSLVILLTKNLMQLITYVNQSKLILSRSEDASKKPYWLIISKVPFKKLYVCRLPRSNLSQQGVN